MAEKLGTFYHLPLEQGRAEEKLHVVRVSWLASVFLCFAVILFNDHLISAFEHVSDAVEVWKGIRVEKVMHWFLWVGFIPKVILSSGHFVSSFGILISGYP